MSKEELKRVGLKTTLPRLKILQLLEQDQNSHLSAEEIHVALGKLDVDIGLATVYRVLGQFEEAGLIIRHRFENGNSIFEVNSGNHHDHLVCVCCGAVVEFVDDIIEKRQTKIASEYGFTITDHKLNIFGLCEKCQTNTKD